MLRNAVRALLGAVLVGVTTQAAHAEFVVLYDQDFENPQNFVNNRDDVNISTTVNENYGGQPAGFEFAQRFTVETLNISGSNRDGRGAAFDTGYSDPAGLGGDFSLGIWDGQDDLLALSFNVGDLPFFNFRLDISSIDLSTFQGPFVSEGDIPELQISLFDNPGGAVGLGSGDPLDTTTIVGAASPQTLLDWTSAEVVLSAADATDGNVTLQLDLIAGNYAALDNFFITASMEAGDFGDDPTTGDDMVIPVPPAAALFLTAIFGSTTARRMLRHRSAAT